MKELKTKREAEESEQFIVFIELQKVKCCCVGDQIIPSHHSVCYSMCDPSIGLLDYGKHHNHDYYGQY